MYLYMYLLQIRTCDFLWEGNIYRSCLRSCVLRGSETWQMKKDDKLTLQQAEIGMIRWTYGINVTDKLPCDELRD